MDIKTLLDDLREETFCSVCMCKFTDPKQLPCLHSFCLHCLNEIQRTSGCRDIACPLCRREFRVPEDGNQALPANFRINRLLDILAITECNKSGVKCGNCDKKSEHTAFIVSSAVDSGVITASVCIMASKLIKITVCWH